MTDAPVPPPGSPGYLPIQQDETPPPGFRDEVTWIVRPPRPKFQHKWRTHILLFGLTLVTTTFPVAVFILVLSPLEWGYAWLNGGPALNPLVGFTWEAMRQGLWYSVPVLTILSAHEFGHYFACRAHNVDATLPYFIPAPIPLTGTLGAVIRIREAFPSKRELFDIGVAGPIAGFVALLPFLVWGMWLSDAGPLPTDGTTTYFGEPLLWKALEWLRFGTLPAGSDSFIHPMGFAAWWGMLATALNLLPFGQLDGGHIMYAALGRHAGPVSAATLGVVVLLTLQSPSWFLFAVMLVVMTFMFGFRHPRIVDEHEPLDPRRRAVALVALIIFVICFTPVPIDTLGD